MNRGPSLLDVHRDLSYGGFDFELAYAICDFTGQEMNEFRAMCVVALGEMEEMWRREQEKKNLSAQAGLPQVQENRS